MKRKDRRLATATLPIMPETSRELRRLLGLASTHHRQLQAVLLADPAAAIALFRELEHARPGAGDTVTDAAHALSLLGLGRFRRVLDSLPKVGPGNPGHAGMQGRESSYSQAAHAAFYADALTRHRGASGNGEIPTAALLQNPAILALWETEPESAQRAANAVRDGVPTPVAFGAELGGPLEDLNRRLAGDWAFPRLARQALGNWDDFDPRPRMVRLADGLAQTTAAGWQHEDSATLTALLAESLDLHPDQASSWLHQQATEAARALSSFDYPLPGFELIFMPRDPQEPDSEDDHAIPEFGARRVQSPPEEQTPAADLHSTMTDVMRRIREQTGSARVIFAMLNRDRSRLRTRLALGGQPGDGLRGLDLDLAQKNLFTALMGKSQSLWLNPDNAARYRGHLPASLRDMLRPEGAYMMSVFVGNKPLGLLYGDGATLSATGYRQFRELCLEAGAVLGGSHRADPGNRIPLNRPS